MNLRHLMLGSCVVLAAACSNETAVPSRTLGTTPGGDSGACTTGTVQQCVCASGMPGLRSCSANAYGACTCVDNALAAPNAVATSAADAMQGAAGVNAPVAIGAAGGPAPAAAPPIMLMPSADNAPTGVMFDWPETDPNKRGAACKPGRYVGDYACRLFIVVNTGNGAFDVAGTIDMRLEQTSDGELLRIADGKFASDTLAAIPMHADIVGELRCSSSRFEVRLENGTFSVALGLPIPFTEGTFAGPLNADYDHTAAQMVDGDWNMQGELDLVPGSCMNGTWSARWVSD